MQVQSAKAREHPVRVARAAFTLMEVLISLVVLTMVMSGLIYGYVLANRMAEYSAMSLASQSYASQGLEQARSAQWNSQQYPPATGPGTDDELYPTNGSISYQQTDTLDVPVSGAPIFVTNTITISTVTTNPPLRQIRSDCVWAAPLSGVLHSNTVITYRAPDE